MSTPLPTAEEDASIVVKTEVGIAHYLYHTLPPGISYRSSTLGGPTADFPVIVLHVTELRTHPDLPPDAGTYLADLHVKLYSSAPQGSLRPLQIDECLDELAAAMLDISGAQTFLNLPETGVDSRPVAAFHLHDIEPTGAALDPVSSDWVETRSYTLTVVAADQTFPPAVVAPTVANYITLGGNHITLGGNRITLAS